MNGAGRCGGAAAGVGGVAVLPWLDLDKVEKHPPSSSRGVVTFFLMGGRL